jgi:hypothetical protein
MHYILTIILHSRALFPTQFNLLMDVQHEKIIMKWITNPTMSIEHLAFECQAQHIWGQHQSVHIGAISWVTKDFFRCGRDYETIMFINFIVSSCRTKVKVSCSLVHECIRDHLS